MILKYYAEDSLSGSRKLFEHQRRWNRPEKINRPKSAQ